MLSTTHDAFRFPVPCGLPVTGNYAIPPDIDKRVMIDVGAACGGFLSERAREFGRAYFLEAHYESYIHTVNRVAAEGINNAVGWNLAAWSVTGEVVHLHRGSDNIGDCYVRNRMDKRQWTHPVLSISWQDTVRLIRAERVGYLKCDIEGAEYNYLMYADLSMVDAIGMELHNTIKWERLLEYLTTRWFEYYGEAKLPGPGRHAEITLRRR